ncbi:hypothetical protein SSX86_027413 [Deinandra increscens subsp. villosa]|uniref:CTLH domain-containing protein n=1 Tax=Deinandra increscens subsp. villosa TaxID=3103831 RepID=A0AAP0GN29_9ASTR
MKRCSDSLKDMKALPSNDEAFVLGFEDINDIIKIISKGFTPTRKIFWKWGPYKVSFYLKMCTCYGVDYQNLEESPDSSDDESTNKTQLPTTQPPFDMKKGLELELPTCVEVERDKYQAALQMYTQAASYCSSATDPGDFRYNYYRHLGLGFELELPTCVKVDREEYEAELLRQMYNDEDLTGEAPSRRGGPFKSGSYLPGTEPDRIPYHLYMLVKEAVDIMKRQKEHKIALEVAEKKIRFFCKYFHSHLPTGWVYYRDIASSLIADYDPSFAKSKPKYLMRGYTPTKDLDDEDLYEGTYLTEYKIASIMGIIYSRKTPKLKHFTTRMISFYCKLCSCFGIDYRRLEAASEDDATSKKVITREEWEKKLNDVKIQNEDMNKLVMNFLVTEGYVDAARERGHFQTIIFIPQYTHVKPLFIFDRSIYDIQKSKNWIEVIIDGVEGRRRSKLMSLFWSVIRQLAEIEAMATSKKVIRREEWEKKLNDVKIQKQDMNKLVMNFLVTEGYVDAAEKFRMESGTEPDIDLATITDRMAVKKAVQSGNVEDAIEKVNDLNPEILDTNPQLFFHLQQQRLIELIRNGKVEEALVFAQEELAPRGEENQSFLEELERTVALLAFEDVKNSPVGDLLDISQRLKIASEVNAAILTSQSHEKDPKLPSLLRMLLWAQNQLDEKAVYPRITNLSAATLEDPAV